MAEAKFDVVVTKSDDVPSVSKTTEKQHPKKSTVKPLTLRQKLKRAFISDEITDVKSYALFDVVIPAIKKVGRELVMNTFDMIFYGKPQRSNRDRDHGAYFDYSRRRDRDDDDRDRRSDRQRTEGRMSVGVRELDRVRFDEREDAVDALSYLFDNIEEYGVATVSDFLSHAGIETNPLHNKWGWYEGMLNGAAVVEDPDGGYWVDMPKPKGV